MGRVREFEDNKVLEKAMILFWEKGYENTSLKDLLKEMNILNGSFYNTFGNKKTLLIKALEYYGKEITGKRANILMGQPTFKKGIRAVFSEMMSCMEDKSLPNGCLLANTLTNELLSDPEINEFVRGEVEKFENFFETHIFKAVKNGELSEDVDPQMTASIIVSYLQGIMRLSCLNFDLKKINQQNEHFFQSIGV